MDKFQKNNRIVNVLNEALSIANEVSMASSTIGNMVLNSIKSRQFQKSPIVGTAFKKGNFSTQIGKENVTIIWEFYNILNEFPENRMLRLRGESDYANRTIKLTIVAIRGRYDRNDFFQTVQHEVSHLFERGKRHKPYKNLDAYKESINVLNSGLGNNRFDNLKGAIANVIYISHKFEQRAFANGAYMYLMKSDDYFNRFRDAIKETRLYQYLIVVDDVEYLIERYIEGGNSIEKYLQAYGLNITQFLNLIRDTKKNISKLIGRIIVKAIEDYRESHEIHEIVEPFEINRKILEFLK